MFGHFRTQGVREGGATFGGSKLKTEYRGTFLGLGYLEIQLQVIRK